MHVFPGRNAYFLILAVAVIDFIWIGMSNIDVPAQQFVGPIINIAILLLLVFLINKFEYSNERMKKIIVRFGYLFQGMIFLKISWIVIRIFNHISMTTNFAYTDVMLSEWDNFLGFNWVSYFNFIQNNQVLSSVLDFSYTSLAVFSFAGFLILVLYGELKRARFFLETFLVTAVICTAIGMFFPAKAAVAMHYGDIATLENLTTLPGVYHIEHMQRLRSGGAISLNLAALPGLVTFPSFHTAAGIILLISFWRTALFPIALIYSAVMIASTPVFGGHYFVDLIAGTALAVLIAYIFASLEYYKGLFAKRGANIIVGKPEASR